MPPADCDIVAYCRGAYCVLAHEAVRMLTEGGRTASLPVDQSGTQPVSTDSVAPGDQTPLLALLAALPEAEKAQSRSGPRNFCEGRR
jgi:hypothetical protein